VSFTEEHVREIVAVTRRDPADRVRTATGDAYGEPPGARPFRYGLYRAFELREASARPTDLFRCADHRRPQREVDSAAWPRSHDDRWVTYRTPYTQIDERSVLGVSRRPDRRSRTGYARLVDTGLVALHERAQDRGRSHAQDPSPQAAPQASHLGREDRRAIGTGLATRGSRFHRELNDFSRPIGNAAERWISEPPGSKTGWPLTAFRIARHRCVVRGGPDN